LSIFLLAQKLGSRLTILHDIAHAGSNRVSEDLKEFARVERIETNEAVILETVGNEIVDRAKQKAISNGV
jgi:ribosome-binding protein aMBF1 (putative translation factor)